MNSKPKMKSFSKTIKNYINKRKLRRYYLKKAQNGKSYLAIILDTLFARILVAIIFFTYFFNKTQDFLFCFIITFQFIVLYSLVLYKIKSIRFKRIMEGINKEIAKKKILDELTNKTPLEFIEYIKLMLEKSTIEDIRFVYEKDIDLVGKLNGRDVGIKCFQYKGNHNVDIKDIRDFFLKLKDLEIDEGMIITTSSFAEDVKEYVSNLAKYAKIHLIDINGLINNIIKKANAYPAEKEIQRYILNQISEKKRKIKEYRNVVLAKGKTTKYILMGIIIYYFGKITPFENYYRVVSYILFALGIISFIKYITSMVKSNSYEQEDNFI